MAPSRGLPLLPQRGGPVFATAPEGPNVRVMLAPRSDARQPASCSGQAAWTGRSRATRGSPHAERGEPSARHLSGVRLIRPRGSPPGRHKRRDQVDDARRRKHRGSKGASSAFRHHKRRRSALSFERQRNEEGSKPRESTRARASALVHLCTPHLRDDLAWISFTFTSLGSGIRGRQVQLVYNGANPGRHHRVPYQPAPWQLSTLQDPDSRRSTPDRVRDW